MAPPAKLVELVNQLPDANKKGMLHTIQEGQVEGIIAKIREGGKEFVIGLLDMLKEPGAGDDYKAWYGVHVLAVTLCKEKDKKDQKAFADTIASQLGGDRPGGVQERIIQTLHLCGGRDHTAAIGKCLADPELCEPAAQALLAINDGAVEQLRKALPSAKGGCRLTILQALGVLRDTESVPAFKKALGDSDREIRLAGAWGLANLGDAGSAGALIKAADAKEWEGVKMTQACLVLAEKLAAAGKKDGARQIYDHFRKTRANPEDKYLADLAEDALKKL